MTRPSSSLLSAAAILAAACFVAAPILLLDSPWPEDPRNHLERSGFEESGADNLVSAIYLGYRAFDTLGEAVVLFAAISGTIGMIAGVPSPRLARPRTNRTDLLDVVIGKLGPIVLIFGFYVMLFGHLSPGGGFQGGVILASGVVFLALGGASGGQNLLTKPHLLARVEATAFLLFVSAGLSGLAAETGFFHNSFAGLSVSPTAFIIVLNAVLGLKVGASVSLVCIAMMGDVEA